MSTTGVGGAAQRRMLGGIIAIAGGLLLALGAFLPWVKVTAAFVGSLSVSGMEGDGIFFLVGGLLISALGLWSIFGTPRAAPALLILSGLGFGGLAFFEFNNVSEGIGGMDSEFALASMGAGIWTLLAGAVATVVAGFTLTGQMSHAPVVVASGQESLKPHRPVRECPYSRKPCDEMHWCARTVDVSRLPGGSRMMANGGRTMILVSASGLTSLQVGGSRRTRLKPEACC
jgi:hypothetical protein